MRIRKVITDILFGGIVAAILMLALILANACGRAPQKVNIETELAITSSDIIEHAELVDRDYPTMKGSE